MNLDLRKIAALVVCLSFYTMQTANAQRQRQYQTADRQTAEYQTANDAAAMAEASLASYNSFDAFCSDDYDSSGSNCNYCDSDSGSCGCDSGSCGCLGSNSLLDRPGLFYVGAEYLQVRATFSESVAFLTQTQTVVNNTAVLTNTFTELEYDYEPSYRIYGGYRLCDCGGDIQFGYTNYDSSAAAIGTAQPGSVVIAPDRVTSLTPETSVITNSGVRAQSYDLAFSKTIPLGCPPSTCCGYRWYPAWDITWSAGIRYAEVDWNRDHAQVDTGAVGNTSSTVLDFEGGGPRWGLEGRRYLGKKQHFDLFLKGDISLLLGNVGITNTRMAVVAGAPIAINTTIFNSTQIIPVLDIVVGGTAYLSDRLTVSGGYLFSAWHDLGMRDTFALLNDPGLQDPTDITFDDANILGFDGFFVRTEFSF